jgi:hypothetical protein
VISRLIPWLVATLAFVLAAIYVYPLERLIPTLALLATVLVAIAFSPAKHLGLLSWSAGIPAFYGLFFLLLPLINDSLKPQAQNDKIHTAIYVVALGVVTFTLGTNAMRLVSGPRQTSLLNLQPNRSLITALTAIGGLAMLWSYFFGYFGLVQSEASESSGAGAISALGFLLTIAHAMAWNTYFRENKLLASALLTTALMLAIGFMANSKEMMLFPLAMIGLSKWGAAGRFPVGLFVAGILFFALVIFPVITASRLLFVASDYGGYRGDLFDLVTSHLASGDWRNADNLNIGLTESITRGLLPYLTHIIEHAGQSVPFMDGRTISEGFGAISPRFLSPGKPDLNIGNWTGREFGVVSNVDYITNVSPSYIGEFYMNFGALGVAAGMFFVGTLAVTVDRWLIADRLVWTMPIFVYLVRWQESFVGHSILTFIKNAVLWLPVLLVAAWLCRRRWRFLVQHQ